jgi:hypothetical protein
VDAQIIHCYQSGKSIAKLSKQYGLTEYKISKLLRQNNVIIRKDNGMKINLNAEKINTLYQSGLTCAEIAKQLGCSDETVRNRLTIAKPRRPISEETKAKIAERSKANWQNESYSEKVKRKTSTLEYKRKLSDASKKNHRNNMTSTVRQKLSQSIKNKWRDPSYRTKQSVHFQERGWRLTKSSLEALKSKAKRQSWIDKIRENNQANRSSQPRISSTQLQLYYILDRAGVSYHKEGVDTKAGSFYVVDCIIPVQQMMVKDLIIEVQGEYWHGLDEVRTRDAQKRTYVRKHTNYDLLELKELDFTSYEAILNRLKPYGLVLPNRSFNTKDLVIRPIDESTARSFYQSFHYSSTVRKGAIAFGGFIGDHLYAAISYTYPIRRQVAISLDKQLKQVMEISRMARATDAVCLNLLSYFIGKTRKLLPPSVEIVISYSDLTYGHTGGVYKAAGFEKDRVVAPDYHYQNDTERYHKKTIWDRSKRMKMTEVDYATKHGLLRVYTGEKFRWVFSL